MKKATKIAFGAVAVLAVSAGVAGLLLILLCSLDKTKICLL